MRVGTFAPRPCLTSRGRIAGCLSFRPPWTARWGRHRRAGVVTLQFSPPEPDAPHAGARCGGRLLVRRSMRAICDPRRSTMKQQAVEERRDWGADIMEVGFHSVLILVVTLLWVYIPA